MRWGIGATGLAALVAITFLILRPGPVTDSTEYTTVRGAPAVGLYVKRGTRVMLWDGQRPVAAGDRLRLKVVAEGFTHVSVLTEGDAGDYSILYEASVEPSGENVLPPAWEVDDAPGDESLTVILSRTPLASDSIGAIIRGGAPGDDVWVRRLSIPKVEESLP
ncbi:MAG: hypothetical protein DRJ42_13440 [Deltaproteobacteria bacterium]|nr:MAG: hypothetical protein DRJ42_13440 [Deltaproteobacteria bacterium]